MESAISRPFHTFDLKELYPTTIEKSAAIIESIVKNHPFIDGNKRTGYTLMRVMLLNDGLDIDSNEDEKYAFVIQIASGEGELAFEQIREWIKSRAGK